MREADFLEEAAGCLEAAFLGAAFAGIIAITAGFPDLDSSTRPIVWSFVIGGLQFS